MATPLLVATLCLKVQFSMAACSAPAAHISETKPFRSDWVNLVVKHQHGMLDIQVRDMFKSWINTPWLD